MTLSVDTLTIDCHDPKLLADFWCAALGYRLDEIDEEGAVVKPAAGPGWTMLFLVVPDDKVVKNRLHLDVRPSGSMAAEVARLEAARRHRDHPGRRGRQLLDRDGRSRGQRVLRVARPRGRMVG